MLMGSSTRSCAAGTVEVAELAVGQLSIATKLQ